MDVLHASARKTAAPTATVMLQQYIPPSNVVFFREDSISGLVVQGAATCRSILHE
jgi:hypothetical protein